MGSFRSSLTDHSAPSPSFGSFLLRFHLRPAYSRLDALREEHADTIRERREEAEEVMELMREHVARRVDAEMKVDGEFRSLIWHVSSTMVALGVSPASSTHWL